MNTVHGKELGWILLRDRKKTCIYPDLSSTRLRIHSVTIQNFHSGERDSGAPRAREARARGWSPIAK